MNDTVIIDNSHNNSHNNSYNNSYNTTTNTTTNINGNTFNIININAYDNKCIIIIDKFDDMQELLNKNTIKLFSKFIDKHETKTMKKNITDKIQLLLYNNRNLVQK